MSDAIDWTKWLPPDPLPDSGPKQFVKGQVWAFQTPRPRDTRPGVFRVTADPLDGGYVEVMALAGRETAGFENGGPFSALCCLVQDVNEPAPRDPRILYTPARADGWSSLCLTCGGPVPAGMCTVCQGCVSNPSVTAKEVGHLQDEWRRIRMSAPAPKVAETAPCGERDCNITMPHDHGTRDRTALVCTACGWESTDGADNGYHACKPDPPVTAAPSCANACGREAGPQGRYCRFCSPPVAAAKPARCSCPSWFCADPERCTRLAMKPCGGVLGAKCSNYVSVASGVCSICESALIPPPASRPSRVVGTARDTLGAMLAGAPAVGLTERTNKGDHK